MCYIELEVSTGACVPAVYMSGTVQSVIQKSDGTVSCTVCSSDLACHFPCAVSNAGVIAGATIGALLGLVAIVFFIYFILKRKKDSEDDIANDIK